jgi:hypothetical protein
MGFFSGIRIFLEIFFSIISADKTGFFMGSKFSCEKAN